MSVYGWCPFLGRHHSTYLSHLVILVLCTDNFVKGKLLCQLSVSFLNYVLADRTAT